MKYTQCKYFNGYKPCKKNPSCDNQCPHLFIPQISLLLVHLGEMGAVLRSTSLLHAIKRKFPSSQITWVTSPSAAPLLQNISLIDRILTTTTKDLLILKALEFEIGLCVDKSVEAVGIIKSTLCDFVYGFQINPSNGAILPATENANELWSLGLNDTKKFFINQKTETQLICEALELGPFQRDEYIVNLSEGEQQISEQRRQEWLQFKTDSQIISQKSISNKQQPVIGINTGCGPVIPYKKLQISLVKQLIEKIQQKWPKSPLVLLGGPSETTINNEIAKQHQIISSPTEFGPRDGLMSLQACDIVITGDSLGMHMAIALKKWVIAWFGPTCSHEIDLYERGVRLQTKLTCGPCWKRSCQNSPLCNEQVEINEIIKAIESSTNSLNTPITNTIELEL